MDKFVKTQKKNQAGATMIEYAMMVSLIAMVAAIGAVAIGIHTNVRLDCIQEKVKDLNADCEL